jgi:hypothetical protein
MSLTRLDVKFAVLKPAPSATQAVGLHMCAAERGATDGAPGGTLRNRAIVQSSTEVIQACTTAWTYRGFHRYHAALHLNLSFAGTLLFALQW